MSATFLTQFRSDTVLTSECRDIVASVTSLKVDVRLIYDPAYSDDEFFSATLYAFGGQVTLSDVGTLIEEYFREHDLRTGRIGVEIDGTTISFTALYCEAIMPDEFNPNASFFTTAPSRRVHRDSVIYLTHASHGHNNYRVQVVGLDPEGNTIAIERQFTITPGAKCMSIAAKTIIDWALSGDEAAMAHVAYFSISYDEMQAVFYLVEDPQYITFAFNNIFNSMESLDIVGTVKESTKVSAEEAVCSGKVRRYDRKVERTFEVTTAPLIPEEVSLVEQMVMSHHVDISLGGDAAEVLITDHTLEHDNDDGTLTSLKFKFRFADSRIRFNADEINALCPARTHIFSEQFTAEFA